MKLPEYVNNLISLIRQKGYETYLVGGAIRDFLLKTKSNDFDLTTNMPYDEILSLCKENKIKANTQGIKHETVGIIYDHNYIEVTCFRGLDKNKLEEDLKLRDFTFNSLAYDGKNIIDVTKGQNDLNKQIIKSFYPDRSFKDDPLRILRMFRFKAKYNFKIDPKTLSSALTYVDNLSYIATERIHDELDQIINYNPLIFNELAKHTILDNLFYEYIDYTNYKDFTKLVNKIFTPDIIKKHNIYANYALLFIILGILNKKDSLVIASELMDKFIFSNDYQHKIKKLIKSYDYSYSLDKSSNLFHLISEIGLDSQDLENLFILNIGIKEYNPIKHRNINSIKNEYQLRKKNNEVIFITDLKVTGDHILRFTKKKNKEVGNLKKELFKMCFFNNSFNNQERLINFLKTI